MTTLRQAAQSVVDRWDAPAWSDLPSTGKHISALRKALEAPEQEHVAYWVPKAEQFCLPVEGAKPFGKAWKPLYAAPVDAPDIKALTKERDALMVAGKLALEALQKLWAVGDHAGAIANPAITALKQAGVSE